MCFNGREPFGFSQGQEGRPQAQDGDDAHGSELRKNGAQHADGGHRARVRVQERRAEPDQRAHPDRTVRHGAEEEPGEPAAVVQDRRDPVAHVAHRVVRRLRFVRRTRQVFGCGQLLAVRRAAGQETPVMTAMATEGCPVRGNRPDDLYIIMLLYS